MLSKPHVSPALAQLRSGVTGLASFVCGAAVVQLLVFGFVHFTQVRWEKIEPRPVEQKLSVITRPATPIIPAPAGVVSLVRPPAKVHSQPSSASAQGAPDVPPAAEAERAPIQPALGAAPTIRTVSLWEVVLRRSSEAAVSVGVVSAVCLAIFTILGVVIAGGGAVPGVERATSSCMWAVALALFAVPWKDVLASVPFEGAFGSYGAMTAFSDAVEEGRGSAVSLFAAHLLLPAVIVAASTIVALRFRSGVDAGIIVTDISELDEKLEQEMENIRKRGVTVGGVPRTVGALNAAIGDTISTPSPTAPREPGGDGLRRRPPDPEPPVSSRSWVSANDRRVGEGDPGDPTKRPI